MAQEVGKLLRALGVGVLWSDVFMRPQRPNSSEQRQHSTPSTVNPPPVAPHTGYACSTRPRGGDAFTHAPSSRWAERPLGFSLPGGEELDKFVGLLVGLAWRVFKIFQVIRSYER